MSFVGKEKKELIASLIYVVGIVDSAREIKQVSGLWSLVPGL
jgi:hypothetical protein